MQLVQTTVIGTHVTTIMVENLNPLAVPALLSKVQYVAAASVRARRTLQLSQSISVDRGPAHATLLTARRTMSAMQRAVNAGSISSGDCWHRRRCRDDVVVQQQERETSWILSDISNGMCAPCMTLAKY